MHGHRGDHQAPARDPRPARRGRHDPPRLVADRRRSATRPATGRADPDPDDGPRGLRHRGPALRSPFGADAGRARPAAPRRPAATYPYLTVNAYNPWALVARRHGHSLANSGLWVCDLALGRRAMRRPGPRSSGRSRRSLIGTALLARRDRRRCSWSAARAARPADAARRARGRSRSRSSSLPTRVHERYGYPFFALGVDPRRDLVALAGRLRRAERRDVREHVRRPRRRSTRDNPSIVRLAGDRPGIRSSRSRPSSRSRSRVRGVRAGRCSSCAGRRTRGSRASSRGGVRASGATSPTRTTPAPATRPGPAGDRRPRRRRRRLGAAAGAAAPARCRRRPRRPVVATMPTWSRPSARWASSG